MSDEIKDIQTSESDKPLTAKKETSSYRSIFKATSLFGGVKVYEILIEIIKSKFIAILLGPLGVGIQGLYSSGVQMIQQLTAMGLSQSAVRNVAEAYGTGDNKKVSEVVTALRKFVWFTGILGMLCVIVFSPLLSKSSFGDSAHIIGFIIISVTLLINQLTAGQRVVLQGTRKYSLLAKCTAIGVTAGLFISIPLYYFWGTDAIVPNFVISSITAFLIAWYFSRKVPVEKTRLSKNDLKFHGKTMITMGVALSLTQLLGSTSSYVLRSFIRNMGGVEAVGLFTAGFILMRQYTGLVFQAMSTDFYPRLAAVNKDNSRCRDIMNQQGEVGLLLLGPLMVVCVVFIPIVVRILYSEEFLAVNDYVIWCAVGVIFQMASWSVSHIFIAKAESKLFFINELCASIYSLGLNLLGYYWGGLTGIGISYVVNYILYLLQVYLIAHHKYAFSFSSSLLIIFVVEILFVIAALLMVVFLPELMKYVLGSILVCVAGAYSLKELNKRMDLLSFIKKNKKKIG